MCWIVQDVHSIIMVRQRLYFSRKSVLFMKFGIRLCWNRTFKQKHCLCTKNEIHSSIVRFVLEKVSFHMANDFASKFRVNLQAAVSSSFLIFLRLLISVRQVHWKKVFGKLVDLRLLNFYCACIKYKRSTIKGCFIKIKPKPTSFYQKPARRWGVDSGIKYSNTAIWRLLPTVIKSERCLYNIAITWKICVKN